jgi:hypothetical protein
MAVENLLRTIEYVWFVGKKDFFGVG